MMWYKMELIGLVLAMASPALAHKGYMTTYSHHIEGGEVEIMALNDLTSPSQHKREEGEGEYLSQMMELKYNPTQRLALEFMWEWYRDVEKGSGRFTGARYEFRYLLFPENDVALNPMVYAEYENLHPATRYKMEVSGWIDAPYEEVHAEESRHKIMESRFILSQDIGRWNASFNWINESNLQSGRSGFGYAMGVFYRVHEQSQGHDASHGPAAKAGLLRPSTVSFELFGALGDDRRFGLWPSRQEHYFQPAMTFHLGPRSMLTVGYGMGLSKASDDLMRLNWGFKF